MPFVSARTAGDAGGIPKMDATKSVASKRARPTATS
jgi:hypothetical protein